MQPVASEENLTAGPLDERVEAKNWKVRVAAYQELKTLLVSAMPGDAVFGNFGSMLKKMVADTNAAAQADAMEAVLAWVQYADRVKEAVALPAVLVERGFNAQRQATRQRAVDVLLMIVEREEIDCVTNALIAGIAHKTPKIAAACVSALREALHQFGAKVLLGAIRELLKESLDTMFNHSDAGVRGEATQLLVEIARWIGEPALKPSVDKLRTAQAKDIEAGIEKQKVDMPGPAKPERLLRSQQAKAAVQAALGEEAQAVVEEEEPAPSDGFDILEPVDVSGKVCGDAVGEALSSTKWQERKAVLDEMVTTLEAAPRIQPIGDFAETGRLLRKVISSDANILVVARAVRVVTLLIRGLRQHFTNHAKMILPAVLDKLKEKKQVVSDACVECLDTMHPACFAVADVMEDITAALDHKVAKVRADTLMWLSRVFANRQSRSQVIPLVKTLAARLSAGLDDSAPEVRDAAATALGALAGAVGERPLLPILAQLGTIKEAKVREHIPTAAIGQAFAAAPSIGSAAALAAKKGGKGAAHPPPAAAGIPEESHAPPPSSARAAVKSKATASGSKAAPATAAKPKPASSSSSSKPAAKAKASAKAAPATAAVPDAPLMDYDTAAAALTELLGASVIAGLADKNWKTRLEVMDKVVATASTTPPEALVVLLDSRPGWRDANLQVLGKVVEALSNLLKGSHVTTRVVAGFVASAAEKLADAKLKAAVSALLTLAAESTSASAVSAQVVESAKGAKNPKGAEAALEWLQQALEDFGLGAMGGISLLLPACRIALESSNAALRARGMSLVTRLLLHSKGALRPLLSDLKPQQLTTIDQAAADQAAAPVAAPTRHARIATASGVSSGSALAAGTVDPLADVPRADISERIPAAEAFGAKDWKDRKAALEAVEAALSEAHERIQLKGLSDLFTHLKARLDDANKMLVIQTLVLLGRLAKALGPCFERALKLFMPALITTLKDNKPQVREAAVAALDDFVAAGVPQEPLIAFFITPISEAVAVRRDALVWMVKMVTAPTAPVTADLKMHMLRPALMCLTDKQKEVRDTAEALIGEIIRREPSDAFRKLSRELKPEQIKALAPLLDRFAREAGSRLINSSASSATATTAASGCAPAVTPTPTAAASNASTANAAPERKVLPRSSSTEALRKETAVPTSSKKEVPAPVKEEKKEEEASTPSGDKKMRAQEDEKETLTVPLTPAASVRYWAQIKRFMPAASVSLMESPEPSHAMLAFVAMASAAPQVTITQLDLYFKWTAALVTANATRTPAVASFAAELLTLLSAQKYRLTDGEASLLAAQLLLLDTNTATPVLAVLPIVYPASKLFRLLAAALTRALSAPARLNALHHMRTLIQRQGVAVCVPADTVPLVAAHASTAELIPAAADLLRLLQATADVTVFLPSTSPLLALIRGNAACTSAPSAANVQAWIGALAAPADASQIEILRDIAALAVSDDPACVALGKHADALVGGLTGLLTALPESLIGEAQRRAKWTVHALTELFRRSSLVADVSKKRLEALMDALLDRLATDGGAEEVSRLINALMLKVLENAPATCSLIALIRLLAPASPKNGKHTELVMKCLIKMTKALGAVLPRLDVRALLEEMDKFLTRARAASLSSANNDLAQKTVKTLLNEMVKLLGQDVMPHLPVGSQTLVAQYVNLMLAQRTAITTGSAAPAPAPAPVGVPATGGEAPLDAELTDIFARIGQPQSSQEGLEALHRFRAAHPSADLEPHLKRTSPHFQAYITRGLAKLNMRVIENADPNVPSVYDAAAAPALGASADASAYLERLRALKAQYNRKEEDSSVQCGKSSELQASELQMRAKSLLGGASSSTAPQLRPVAVAPSASTVVPTSNLQDLQERLARLKRAAQT